MSNREREHRKNAEFSWYTRCYVKARARGRCEHPEGCTNHHNDTIDHITPCFLGELLGMEKKTLRSIENAQMLCDQHDIEKRMEEKAFIAIMELKLMGYKIDA